MLLGLLILFYIMATTIRLTCDQKDLLEWFGTVVHTNDGENKYMYLPFWFKETNTPGIYEVYSLENIPDDLKEAVDDIRNTKADTD